MKKMIIHMVILMLSISIWGCASFTGYPERSGNVEDELKQLDKYLNPEIIAEYDKEQDQNKKLALRNEIINARIRAIDIHFNDFQQRLYSEGVGSNIATDWTVIGLGVAGSITSSLSTTQNLSAISGGITGAKASFDKNAFFDRTMPAILSQMIALRKSALVKIRSGLKAGVSEYPLNWALIDLEEYFMAGTMPGAVIGIVEEAGATTKKADSMLELLLPTRTKEFITPEREEQIKQILTDVNDIGDQDAFELNKNPPVKEIKIDDVVKLRDPPGMRFTDGYIAREMLKMRVVLSKRDNEALDAWEAALKAK